MEKQSYISCIKINGVPILPPVMTDEIRKEMNYYKSLAIAIEKRRKKLYSANKRKKNAVKCSNDLKPVNCDNKNICANIDNNVSSEEVNDSFTQEENIRLSFDANKSDEHEFKSEVVKEIAEWKSVSDSENLVLTKENFEITRLASEKDSVDLHEYDSESVSTKFCSTEASPKVWKPEVPTSLDVVPITVDEPVNKEEENAAMAEETTSTEDVPKLVRQGSYILESPSPMLLAHLQTELGNEDDISSANYVPTTSSTTKRKEWKITQNKTEWENQNKCQEYTTANLEKANGSNHAENDEFITMDCQVENKSQTEAATVTHHFAQSTDCIQELLAKESTENEDDDEQIFIKQKNHDDVNAKYSPQIRKMKKRCVLNLETKLNKSLQNVYTGTQCIEKVEKDVLENAEKNLDCEVFKDDNTQSSASKLLSSVTSDKVANVLKQVQEVHKKQILELISCQRKAQILLQKEFEKQQMMLFTHIKKSLLEIPVLKPAETTSLHSRTNTNYNGNLEDADTNAINDVDDLKELYCPLNYLNNESVLYSPKFYESSITNTKPLRDVSCGHNNNYRSDSQNDYQHEEISSDKQLFLSNFNPNPVPILYHSKYTEKHVHAVNLINAHVRGYLVRRLMATERVIALKSTYKEALQCMLRLHIDAPLNLPELNFLHRLQLQCDAASMNIVELFAQPPAQRMQVIAHDRELKRSRLERSSSTRSYSFATQRTLARKKLREYDPA